MALGIKGVYNEHLHQALHGKASRPRPEVLLEDVRDRIEQGPARQLANELFKQGPKEVAEAVLASMRDRPETAEFAREPPREPPWALTGEPPEEPPEEPPGEPIPKPIGKFAPRACDVADAAGQDVRPGVQRVPGAEQRSGARRRGPQAGLRRRGRRGHARPRRRRHAPRPLGGRPVRVLRLPTSATTCTATCAAAIAGSCPRRSGRRCTPRCSGSPARTSRPGRG